jgi:hypothetical protein
MTTLLKALAFRTALEIYEEISEKSSAQLSETCSFGY